jgi:hypothetical protein
MKNFVLWTLGIIITVLLIILINGQLAVPYFKFESNVQFDVGKILLWTVMDDIDNYSKNKKNIVSVDKGEYYGDSVIFWTENYQFGIKKKYEVLRKKSPELLILSIENSLTGMKTKLYFEIKEDERKSYLKIIEESELRNIFWAGLKVLLGRDSFVNSEIKWIRVALYNHLIKK